MNIANPRPDAVFTETCPPPPLLGEGRFCIPLPYSRTNGGIEAGEAAMKALNPIFSKEVKKSKKGNKLGQGQVKSQNRYFLPYRLPGRNYIETTAKPNFSLGVPVDEEGSM